MAVIDCLINKKVNVETQKSIIVGYLTDYDNQFIVVTVKSSQRFSLDTFEKTIFIPINTIVKITLFEE